MLNCASRSCPPIGVYTPDQLDQQFDQASANYINQETTIEGNTLMISKLFSWYQADFGGRQGVTEFILRYLPKGQRRSFLLEHPKKFKYAKYDWGLYY